MTYVVTQPCCNDASCVEVCPVDCIRPTPRDPDYRTTEMLYIDPKTCIDCGACMDACPVDAIYQDSSLPAKDDHYKAINAEYFELHPLKSKGLPFFPLTSFKVPREEVPLRVAVVGAGPSACYAAGDLLTHGANGAVEIDMVVNLGKALSADWDYVQADVKAVCDEAHKHGAKVDRKSVV